MAKQQPKVAIVCEWLVGIGGAERVVLEVHRMFPDAPIYTSQYDSEKLDWFKGADVRTGWLQTLPTSLKKFLPVLRAWYFSHLDLSEYDLVIICNFGAEAKAARTRKDATSICLCNAPTHYYWSRYESYLRDPGFPTGFNWLARLGLRLLVAPMRRWDYRAAQKPDHMVAISTHIQKEIKKYYGRDTEVIHPPVDIERFEKVKAKKRHGFVITGRQTPYKRIDLAVAACTKLNLPLTVIGHGPEHDRLVQMAGPTISFKGLLPESEVAQHLANAEAFIFPGLDDFGISPVEAMATGTPVIAYQAGGALDYVVPDETGVFFKDQTVESLAKAIQTFRSKSFKESAVRDKAQFFSQLNFHKKLKEYINKVKS